MRLCLAAILTLAALPTLAACSPRPRGAATAAPEAPELPASFDAAEVDAAYAAALQAGGRDDGPPAPRLHFNEGYYAANVIDFDGNRLEFVHKRWNPKRPA